MEKIITVEEYLKDGGYLEYLNLNETFYNFNRRTDKPIKSINLSNQYNKLGERMVEITNWDDQTFSCHPMWLETKVEYILHYRYKNPNLPHETNS
jgi:hypothetical protein